MDFLEKDLEEIIYLCDKHKLSRKGLHLEGKLKRQLRIGNYGIADLVEITRPQYDNKIFYKGTINILELKKDKIGVSTFFQALNYLQGVKTYLSDRRLEDYFNFKITLIGKDLDFNSSFVFLGDIFEQDLRCVEIHHFSRVRVELYTYSYGIDGLEFKEISNYNLINKGF